MADSLDPIPVIAYAAASRVRRRGAGLWAWVTLGTFVAPCLAMALAAFGAMAMLQQNAQIPELLMFAFHPLSAWPAYALILWAAVAAASAERNGDSGVVQTWVRHGIYTGVLLNAAYLVILSVMFMGMAARQSADAPAWIVARMPLAMLITHVILTAYMRRCVTWSNAARQVGNWLAVDVVVVFVMGLLTSKPGTLLLSVVLWAAPGMPSACFGILTILVSRERSVADRPGAGVRTGLAWGGASCASLVCAVLTYPTLRTGGLCYVATAASRGHRWFVRSSPVVDSKGELLMTRQLRTAICAEIALYFLSPPVRRGFRRIYDRLGPVAARRITTPWRADVAYLIFKPVEWAGWLLLRTQVRRPGKLLDLLGRRAVVSHG